MPPVLSRGVVRLALGLAAGLAAGMTAHAETPRNVAGTVEFVEGQAMVQKPDKARRALKVGDTVFEGDGVGTGSDGEVHLQMQDGGYLALRPATKMTIVKYAANGDEKDTSVMNLIEGSLRSVSGWIAQFNPKGYQVRATGATIGVRGTDHETLVRLKDDAQGEAGVYDRVYAGGTFIETAQGRVDVGPERVGFHSRKAGRGPRVLDRVPGFFRATRNERLIEGRHARINPQLQKLREERRAARKAAAGDAPAKGHHKRQN